MRWTNCTKRSGLRSVTTSPPLRLLSCVLVALAISACSSGQRRQLASPSLPAEPPARVQSHLRANCPAVLPTPANDSGKAVLEAWIAAARIYHRCRESKAALAASLSIYEQAVEQAHCKALLAARLGVCAN